MTGKVIPFPSRDLGTDDLPPDDDLLDGFEMVSVPADDAAEVTDDDADEIIANGGRWVWQDADSAPDPFVPVGMVSHRIETMCRWRHRHIMDGLTEPQPCCYSVLITLARMPGEVQPERNWLAMQEDPS